MIKTFNASRKKLTRALAGVMTVLVLTVVLPPFSMASGDLSSALNTMKSLDRTTPNTIITRLDGTEAAFSDLTGRPMLVNFWASWCAPCVAELPELVELDHALSQDGMGVMLIGIDRKGHEFGESFLAKKGITIPARIYAPSGDLPRELGLNVMPTSFLITSDGKIVGKIEGPLNWASPKIIAAVKSALNP